MKTRRKDGSTFPLHLAVNGINAGERKLFAGIIGDFSDLKAVELELVELNVTLPALLAIRFAILPVWPSHVVQMTLALMLNASSRKFCLQFAIRSRADGRFPGPSVS